MAAAAQRDADAPPPAQDAVALRLLGHLELSVRDQALPVGPPQRQMVLAALAVDADAPVPVDLLVDRVWDSRPPDGARAALHAHIARLRRTLAESPPGGPRLTRHNGSYVLEMDRTKVDLHRFRDLLHRARAEHGDAERRVELARRALTIWRGPPLANVSGDWASRLRTSVEPQLISAAVMWAESELRFGHVHQVIDKLSHLTVLHPLSEPLTGALMRALCAAGRRSEALQRFAAVRDRLREELGTEPGTDLRELHTAVLRGDLEQADADPTTADADPARAARAGAPPRVRPRQLPPAASGFSGRTSATAELVTAVTAAADRQTVGIAAVDGWGGVGTSALVIRAAHQLAEMFPDGQLYADLGGRVDGTPRPPGEVLDGFLHALAIPAGARPTATADAAALFRSATAGRRLLTVLDNACDLAQVQPLLPASAGAGVLIASRRMLVGLDGAHHVHLDVFTEQEAIALLRQVLGAARVDAEPAATAAVAQRCGYVPLALRAAAARLAARPRWPISALAARLADETRRMAELDAGELSVRRCFARSYQELTHSPQPEDHEAADLFARLGRLDTDRFTAASAASQLGLPTGTVAAALERLVDARMLDSPVPDQYHFPPLLQLFAREQPVR